MPKQLNISLSDDLYKALETEASRLGDKTKPVDVVRSMLETHYWNRGEHRLFRMRASTNPKRLTAQQGESLYTFDIEDYDILFVLDNEGTIRSVEGILMSTSYFPNHWYKKPSIISLSLPADLITPSQGNDASMHMLVTNRDRLDDCTTLLGNHHEESEFTGTWENVKVTDRPIVPTNIFTVTFRDAKEIIRFTIRNPRILADFHSTTMNP